MTTRTTSEIRAQVETMLLAGQTPRQVARGLKDEGCTLFGEDEYDNADDDMVALPGWRADDGNAQMDYPGATSGKDAAQEYVDAGDWGSDDEADPTTSWVTVEAWRVALRTVDGAIVEERVDDGRPSAPCRGA